MKKISLYLIILIGLFALPLFSQSNPDKITVPLTDPSRPAFLKVSLLSGGITVKGYSGKDVIVEAHPNDSDEDDEDDENRDEKNGKKRGLRRIPNVSTGLTVEEDDNEVTVGTGAMNSNRATNLVIQVPTTTSLKLSTLNDGDIKVNNITGDVEISNLNGSVSMDGISGSAVVDAMNGEINVAFTKIDSKKSMSFSSMNGDIDVTFPTDLKATVRLKNDMGEIYSDFDIKMDYSAPKVEDTQRDKRGRRRISMEKMMSGTINGGGSDIMFKNFNGDIYIRKGK